MGGWKTWVGVIGGVCTGIGMICAGLLTDPIDINKIWEGILVIIAAFGLVGIGHKIEKNKV